MVYPCFYYSLKACKRVCLLVYYTTKEEVNKYQEVKKKILLTHLTLGIIAAVAHSLSMLLLATQNTIELMMKLVESIVVIDVFFEFTLMRLTLDNHISLINEMKMKFSTIDAEIVRRCKKEEKVWFFTFASLAIGAFMLAVSECFILKNEEWNQLRANMYGYKHPEHIVPANFYFPGNFVDLSASPFYYIYMTMLPYYATILILITCLPLTLLGIHSIHIKGQYEILLRYINLIPRQEKDAKGNFKYYTNIVTGKYFTCDPTNPNKVTFYTHKTNFDEEGENFYEISENTKAITWQIIQNIKIDPNSNQCGIEGDHLNQNRRHSHEYNPVYEEHFLKQIIKYQQFLLYYRSRVEGNMRPVVITTCFCFISLVALSSQIVLKSVYKVAYSFCFVIYILHLHKLIEFSNGIDTGHREIQSLLYFDSKWYKKSKKIKDMIGLIILRCQKSENYSFHAGFVTFDRPLMVSLLSRTYTFINWLHYVDRRG